ncbi:class I SAM-dependent methyltransferase [Prolixibacter sp. NT017]|uniref:class I SAM-dependent methyltransferase n=1 Tax=Prolixibacter sp. NT017 TaxID=2652390 RepID=UPI00127076AB|nr:class I SAM-dependent methyltransferase [Prolixibacter sp. NT017]GET23970.1 S-adenosyl-L-methionine-dependent methyltransferase [Prolixibacter sp. NT017]
MERPDNTAVRTALWRALHVQVDAEPYILEDEIGLKLVAPSDDWQQRPDMRFTQRLRASVVGRARFVEDFIVDQSKRGISQLVVLGAGLDTFAQRKTGIASKLQIYEIDRTATLDWKRQRLTELGFRIPKFLHYVGVNFEMSSWWDRLLKAGFDVNQPTVLTCTGVSLYLTREANVAMLNQVAELAPGSKVAISFYLPVDLLDEEDRAMQNLAEKGAQEAGTPMMSFFSPDELLALGTEAGINDVRLVTTKDLEYSYFSNRTDNLLPASGEIFLLGTTSKSD